MTPDQQRIAIHVARGLCRESDIHNVTGRGLCYTVRTGRGIEERLVPNYPADLNAMHEAEKVLNAEQLEQYGALLRGPNGETVSLYSPEHREIALVAMASADLRATAFIEVIK